MAWRRGKKQDLFLPGDTAARTAGLSLPARMIVYKITLPVNTFSTNDKIWSQLNEDAIDSKTNVLLAQNGLRGDRTDRTLGIAQQTHRRARRGHRSDGV